MSIRHLDRLLGPESVAVVGASDRVGSVGATVWRNLRAGHFTGAMYAVNPKHTTIDGIAVYPRVVDLPQAPDLAVLCTPPCTVPCLVDELGRLGTRAAIGRRLFCCQPERPLTRSLLRDGVFVGLRYGW